MAAPRSKLDVASPNDLTNENTPNTSQQNTQPAVTPSHTGTAAARKQTIEPFSAVNQTAYRDERGIVQLGDDILR
ncbi:MAG: hypothetical protein ACT4QE_07670, partial [Anaerolineales bacterium]